MSQPRHARDVEDDLRAARGTRADGDLRLLGLRLQLVGLQLGSRLRAQDCIGRGRLQLGVVNGCVKKGVEVLVRCLAGGQAAKQLASRTGYDVALLEDKLRILLFFPQVSDFFLFACKNPGEERIGFRGVERGEGEPVALCNVLVRVEV